MVIRLIGENWSIGAKDRLYDVSKTDKHCIYFVVDNNAKFALSWSGKGKSWEIVEDGK